MYWNKMTGTGPQAPIFIVSVRYRQEVTAAIEASGRSVVAVRRPDEASRRFAQSASSIAIVDARGALAHGLKVTRQLAAAVEARRGALAVLLSRSDAEAIGDVYEAGATHFLISPFSNSELGQALRFADRYVRRMQETGVSAAVVSAQAALTDTARWHWSTGEGSATISPSLAALLGQPVAGPIDVTALLRRLETPERLKIRRGFRRLLISGSGGDIEHKMLVDGTPHRIVHHVRVLHGPDKQVTGLTATVEDLDAAMLERRLSAHFDPLTGLANQGYAQAWIDQLLGGRTGHDPACIIVQMAISRFDQVNASYGRAVADSLLQAVARRVRHLAGSENAYGERMLLARLGGAEFAIAFAGPTQLKDVVAFAQSLGEAFERPFAVEGRVIHLSSRMGIAAAEADLDGAETLFRRASAALAEAKSAEPNSYRIFMPGEGEDARERMADLQTDLRRALESDELDIVYQPQVDVASQAICGVEALVRWRHPVMGLLPAETLLDVAASAELTGRLSEHIIDKALREAAAWEGPLASLRLSVNVTADDLKFDDFDRTVMGVLRDTGFPVERLTIEVTEGGLMENLDKAALLLSALRDMGVRVAIDDFGTGYSSLAYLKSLPLDYLKIDRSLVTDVVGSPRGRVVVRGIVDMARSLEMDVVAEGVETPEQLDLLVHEGCGQYQGFLCAQPMPAAELAPFIAAWEQGRAAAA
ncbi:putative bifunctional diguanylate cyclase/phosphodiesterase [Sphingoaurantiacus capsulatus]|uniref:Bifunctional diguanylate cyclase/phosphodiesterase n=1 Tax=Sphingoaurantiacus capsulatus TaxID=1771310 RepID=A0ABV7XEU7_9SPHN